MVNYQKDRICKDYYEKPTQVMFIDINESYDRETPKIIGGIAYQDEIICGCCGSIFSIEELIEDYLDAIKVCPWLKEYEPIRSLSWIDIEDAIRGGAPDIPSDDE